jgi:AraC family transcriptional regulator, exoenzyme S synthesis regulatory protein ExsA
MGEHATITSRGEILFAICEKKTMVSEQFIPEHMLAHIYSGSVSIAEAEKNHTFTEGDTFLLKRNLLAKFVNYPTSNAPFRSMLITLDQHTLQEYYMIHSEKRIKSPALGHPEAVRPFARHPAFNSLFNSLLPYYELDHNLPEELLTLKFHEAITILRKIDQASDTVLADFCKPGKIDLVGFMHKNYLFNIPFKKFAYLTGRSLAAFKRDFQKAFHTSPEKWVRQKRLERAHFLIREKGKRPSEVYLEVGFETFSHFSFSFKKCFGYSPSRISHPL